jgi:hypothetical protein
MKDQNPKEINSICVVKPTAEEPDERLNTAELHEESQKEQFIWSDKEYVQRSVKMICTNYDLD